MKKYLDLSHPDSDKLLTLICDSHLKTHGFQGHGHINQLISLIKKCDEDECRFNKITPISPEENA